MRWIMKSISTLLVLAYTLSLTGCGGGAEKQDRLVMWLVGSESQARTIMKLGEKFKEKTGTGVYCQAISWGNAHSKYLTSIAGAVSPDIGTMGLTWGMEFGDLGALVDLNQDYPEDLAAMEKSIFPSLMRSTHLGDKVYGIPFDLTEQVMYYRTDIVGDPPQTWEEFLQKLKELQAQEKGAVMDWGSLEWISFSPYLWQAGGSFYNEDYSEVTLDTPEAKKALSYYARLYQQGIPRTKVPLEQGMRTGDYPLAISGNWKIISLQVGAPEIKGKWSIAQLPKGPTGRRTAFIGGRILSVFSRSEKKKEAWEFIRFLLQPENQVELFKASKETENSYLPPNMESWDALPMDEDFKRVLKAQAKDAKGPPPVLSWDASTKYVNYAVQMAVLKNADPAEQLKEAERQMQLQLERARR